MIINELYLFTYKIDTEVVEDLPGVTSPQHLPQDVLADHHDAVRGSLKGIASEVI